MLWFFKRDDQLLRLETRYDNDRSEYVVILHHPDGQQQAERFTEAEGFRTRLDALENGFEADGWVREGPPVFLPDGWPRKPPEM